MLSLVSQYDAAFCALAIYCISTKYKPLIHWVFPIPGIFFVFGNGVHKR